MADELNDIELKALVKASRLIQITLLMCDYKVDDVIADDVPRGRFIGTEIEGIALSITVSVTE